MKRTEFIDKIKRTLGAPYIKVELTNDHINDAIVDALKRFIEYAAAQATDEVYMTVLLSGGQAFYDLPEGVRTVVSYDDDYIGNATGHNTLFTIDNYMYMQGMINFNSLVSSDGILALHAQKDFIDTLRRYSSSGYQWRYHNISNQLEIIPPPPCNNYVSWTETNCDGESITYTANSPGWVLLRTWMLKGSTKPGWVAEDTYEYLFENCDWIFEYVLALCKMKLGLIRRKHTGGGSIGNTGFDMDGGDLFSEGSESKRELEERLDLTESYEGFGLFIG